MAFLFSPYKKETAMNDRFVKIKQHFKDHKEKYLIGAGGVVVGVVIGGAVVYFRKGVSAKELEGAVKAAVANNPSVSIVGDINAPFERIIDNRTVINQFVERAGHPGRKLYCPELDAWFDAVADAARETGVSRRSIQQCADGVIGSVKGLRFFDFGDADAPVAE